MNFSNWILNGSSWCQSWLPHSAHSYLTDSLVCGTPLLEGHARRLFIDAGLIHILVVSGAHLHFLDGPIQRLPRLVRLMFLGSYCWLTGFGIPVMRAWLRRLCDGLSLKLKMSPLQAEALTLILILIAKPQWYTSRSFVMCWLCAIALSLPPLVRSWPHFSKCLACYLLLFPLCPSAPTSILFNLILTPLIGVFLLPLALLVLIVPSLNFILEWNWSALIWILEQSPILPPAPIYVSSRWLWCYPVTLHLVLLFGEIAWRRRSAFF